VPVDLIETNGQNAPKGAAPTVTPQQAKANLIHDSRAAAAASGDSPDGPATPEQHVLSEAESTVSDEGENLIGDHA
jgi:hypothetical protein